MKLILILVLAVLSLSAAEKTSFADSIKNSIKSGIQSVVNPIGEKLVSFGSKQCKRLKKALGVNYGNLKDEDKPDLEKLSLQWTDGTHQKIFKINDAAVEIPGVEGFNTKMPLIIFLHGFTSNPTKKNNLNLVKALQARGQFNVLSLDSSPLIKDMYLRSTTYVRYIGEELGRVLAALAKMGVKPAKIHLIGHSLGAHISGFTGKAFTRLTGKRVGRISGLDPAGPCFTLVSADMRLKFTDADFVDVIHTDAGTLGIQQDIGQVDFYPNSGKKQPGCAIQTCSHTRAVELYTASITKPESFPAYNCEDWDQFRNGKCNKNKVALMGYGAKPGTKGVYYLQTNGESPFGRGLKGLKFEKKNLG